MKNFTFVTMSYNHEDYITEHLESIKSIIVKYGSEVNVNYVLCDDCSKDETVNVVSNWIKRNPIFQSVKININDTNIGIVGNYIKAISMVETDDFKLLAGDDVYGLFDIFKLFNSIGDSLLCTPVTPFGNVNQFSMKGVEAGFRVLMYMDKKGCAQNSIRILNLMPAPGVFYKLSLVKDVNLINYLKQFKYIEDYPLFYYLLNIKKVNIMVSNVSRIYYRVGSGISTSLPSSSKHIEYLKDKKKLRVIIGPKFFSLPKYINPYRYYLKFIKMWVSFRKDSFPIFCLPNK